MSDSTGRRSDDETFMLVCCWNIIAGGVAWRVSRPDPAAPAVPPSPKDRETFAKNYGLPQEAIGYTDFIAKGKWNVDDVLRPIYEEASKALGREFPYPEDKKE